MCLCYKDHQPCQTCQDLGKKEDQGSLLLPQVHALPKPCCSLCGHSGLTGDTISFWTGKAVFTYREELLSPMWNFSYKILLDKNVGKGKHCFFPSILSWEPVYMAGLKYHFS